MRKMAGKAISNCNRTVNEAPFDEINMAHETKLILRLDKSAFFLLVVAVVAPFFVVWLVPGPLL